MADRGTSLSGDCLKLTSYFGERHRTGRDFTGNALLDLYANREIAASVLLRGTQGFGLRQHLRTDRSLTLSEDLPVVAVAVDTRARIESVLDQTLEMAPGLVTLEHARLLDDDSLFGLPVSSQEEETKLTVYLGSRDQAYQIPAYEAICDLLYRRCIAGATALLGVDGTRRGRRQRARLFSREVEVPMMVIAVAPWDQTMGVIPGVSRLLRHPLLTLELVRVCKRDGLFLGVPDRSPGTGGHGMALCQKLTVYTSAGALHEGQPIHRTLARRLRSAERGLVTSETIPAIRTTAGGGRKGQP
jgi:PII-like signaling protein